MGLLVLLDRLVVLFVFGLLVLILVFLSGLLLGYLGFVSLRVWVGLFWVDLFWWLICFGGLLADFGFVCGV